MTARNTIPVNMALHFPRKTGSAPHHRLKTLQLLSFPTCGCFKAPARSLEAEKVEIHHGEGARCTKVVDYSKTRDPDFG